MEKVALNILLLEEAQNDAAALLHTVEQAGYAVVHERVSTRDGIYRALRGHTDWDLIVAGESLASFLFTESAANRSGDDLGIPIIIVAEDLDIERMVGWIETGAFDVVDRKALSAITVSLSRALGHQNRANQLAITNQHLRCLLHHNEQIRERERSDIARMVHDDLGGLMTAIKMEMRQLQKLCNSDTDEGYESFALIDNQLDSAIKSVRHIITELHPSVLDNLGLVAAIEWQLQELSKQKNIKYQLVNNRSNIEINDSEKEVALFRLFQDVLRTLSSDGEITQIAVTLVIDNGVLIMEIDNNGAGISEEDELQQGHYDILSMKERSLSIGASLEVCAGERGGSRFSLRVPM
ncbi:MAG: histidine kinase [Chromatiales bacterium]|nr:histidine kinase [Chromatiales bacterium]